MTYKVQEIEGIGPAYGKALESADIKTTERLLQECAHKKGREAIAVRTGLKEAQLLKWANMADLMRISGVGGEYAELLEAAGVDTIKELRTRNAGNLAAAMKQTNEKTRLTRLTPSSQTIEKWIEVAKEMEPLITH